MCHCTQKRISISFRSSGVAEYGLIIQRLDYICKHLSWRLLDGSTCIRKRTYKCMYCFPICVSYCWNSREFLEFKIGWLSVRTLFFYMWLCLTETTIETQVGWLWPSLLRGTLILHAPIESNTLCMISDSMTMVSWWLLMAAYNWLFISFFCSTAYFFIHPGL